MSSLRMSAAAVAVALTVAAPYAFAQEAAPMGEAMMPEPVVVGDLAITQPWARATPPAAATGAGYLTITNNGATDDRLLSITSPIAEISEVHEMTMTDDRMVMRPLEDGLTIPAGETVVLRPGGFHLMFVQLVDGFVEGTEVTVTLTFETAGAVEINLLVYPIGSDGPAGTMEGMDGMEGMGAMGGTDEATP